MRKILLFVVFSLILMLSNAQNFNYDIKFHRLELNVDPNEDELKGAVTTYFTPISGKVKNISFELSEDMTVDSVKLMNQSVTFSQENDFVNISFSDSIASLDSVFVYYHGIPAAAGLGSYIKETHQGAPIIWTLSEPFGAKSWWPCKQILTDKADSMEMVVTVPKGNRVAGNGVITKIDTLADEVTVHWKHRYPITPYLVAFAVTNYEEYYDYVPVNDSVTVPILNYVFPEDIDKAKSQTPDIIDVFQFYCDSFIVYPFYREKYGHAQFKWGGGMEHQTMSFMINFNHSLMAHELAHQWFGDYITCGSWHNIWLNEGFATYLEGLTAEQGLAPYSWLKWKKDTRSGATSASDGSVYCDDTTDINRIFSSRLTYKKGAMIIHLMRQIVGDANFFAGLKSYLSDPALAFGFATPDDLKRHMEAVSGKSLDQFFADWYYGKGFPLYSVEWRQDKDMKVSFTIRQTQSVEDVDFFDAPVSLKLEGDSKDTTIVFYNNKQDQQFGFEPGFKVKNVIFDPEYDLITKNPIVSQVNSTENINKITSFVYPNPTKDFVYISFENQTFIQNYSLTDVSGKIIFSERVNSKEKSIRINLKDVEQGYYFLTINTNKSTLQHKIVRN